VTVLSTFRQVGQRFHLIGLPDGRRLSVPEWMLDPVACARLPQAATPRLSLAAAARLLVLLERSGLRPAEVRSNSGPSPLTKGTHVPRESSPTLPTDPGPGSPSSRAVGTTAPSPTSALPSVAGPTAAPSRPPRSTLREARP
jgi:hypothetical protein